MRYWLGLLLFAGAALSSGGAVAAPDSRVEALNAAMKCAEVADDAERLRCYDAAMGRLKEAIEITPQEQVAAFGKPQEGGGGFSVFGLTIWGQAQTPEQFGAEQVAAARDDVEGLGSIQFKISDYAYTPLGLAIVFLENGQVWRQMEGKKIRFPNDPEKRYATISTGTIGGYRMTIGDLNRSYAVRRIK